MKTSTTVVLLLLLAVFGVSVAWLAGGAAAPGRTAHVAADAPPTPEAGLGAFGTLQFYGRTTGLILVLGLAGIVVAVIYRLILWAQLVYPQDGLYPATPARRALNPPLNQPHAQVARGLAYTRLSGMGPAVRQILAPEEPPLALPAPPARATVYAAALPDRAGPALLIGETAGGPLALPLRNLGNVLVGGLPGMGKSELLAAMIVGILRQDPAAAAVRLAVIDPKRVDFGQMPADLAALAWPVATRVEDGQALIGLLHAETEARFDRLEAAGARTLAQYNAQAAAPLPYLVALIDELADLTGDAGFVERALAIGRKGRAAGVSLVLATQRPSADLVPSGLRAVCGAQIAFRVLNASDSRTILGVAGAETLPANVPGRCLVRRGELQTVQAYYAGLEDSQGFYAFVGRARRGAAPLAPARPPEAPPVAAAQTPANGAAPTGGNRWQPVVKLAKGQGLTAEQAAWVREHCVPNTRRGINWATDQLWGYGDDTVDGYVHDALEGRI